jgi:hypothetical protein
LCCSKVANWFVIDHEPLGILFEQYATDHSVVIYGEPSPELMQNAAKMGGVGIKTYSFLHGLD